MEPFGRFRLQAQVCLAVILCAASAAAKTVHVQVGSSTGILAFSPANVNVNVGDTVQWDWAGNMHSTTSGSCNATCMPDGNWDSGATLLNSGATFSHTFAQTGTFPYYCRQHGLTFKMRGTITVLPPADFTLLMNNVTAGPVFPGQTAKFQGTITALNGWANLVALNCVSTGPPLPATCGSVPSSTVPSPTGTSLTVSAGDPGTPPRDFQFFLSAVGNDPPPHTVHQTPLLTLHIVDFDFSAPPNVTVSSTATSPPQNFLLSGFNGFSGTVNFACSGLPANVQCNFNPNPATPGTVSLSVTTTHAQQTTNPVTVTVTATTNDIPNAPVRTHTFQLTIKADYQLAISNPVLQLFPSDSGNFNGALTPLDGYVGTVTITCGPFDPTIPCAPPGAALTVGPASPQFSAGITTGGGGVTIPGDYAANISGTDSNGLPAHLQPVTVRVVDFKIAAPNGTSISTAQGNPSAPVAIQVSALGSWSPQVGFSCAPAICSFSSSSARPSPGAPQTIEMVVNPGSLGTGSSTLTLTASVPGAPPSAGQPATIDFTLNITAGSGSADLSVALSHAITTPQKVSDPAPVGSEVTFTVTANEVSGSASSANVNVTFSGPVSFGALPVGCAPIGGVVVCSISVFPASFAIPVIVPFGRSVTAQAFVNSAASETAPDNNQASDTVQVRPRPLARQGLPPIQP